MSNYLHATICDVEDSEFHKMIDELYHCVDWPRDDENSPTFFLLLSAIFVQDPKAMTRQHLPAEGILTTNVAKLNAGGAVASVCEELARIKGDHIESFDKKTVLSLLKKCFPRPSKRRARTPTRNQLWHQASTRIIRQRRANGDL